MRVDSSARKKRKIKKAAKTEADDLFDPTPAAEDSLSIDMPSMDVTSTSITPLPSRPCSPYIKLE